ncbi:MAG: FAD binding domain-containing protein, partial [Xanthobacteraceae bacterium]
MYAFTYHRATGLRHAANMLEKLEEAKLLAGGQTLLPTMKQRLASPNNIIDLGEVEGMAEITQAGRSVTIGAMARHNDVANSEVVQKAIPALAYLAGLIGDPAVRHRGTIGGSVANNDPNADYPAACLGLGATIVTNKR